MREILAAVVAAVPLFAQAPLTIQDAVRIAVEKHPSIEEAVSNARAAEYRIAEGRAAYLPRVDYSESWARSNNPVFVFGSLLTQHQFRQSNFQLERLNRPDFLDNFQSQLAVEQTVYDWGSTKARVRTAEFGRDIANEQERGTVMRVTERVVRMYYAAVLAQATLDAAVEALKSAQSDAERAQSIRQAGMSTDADLLSIRVHLAAVREQQIRRKYEFDVSLAALNESLGLPIDAQHSLATGLTPARPTVASIEEYVIAAARNRPELKQTALAAQVAGQQSSAAKSAILPQFAIRGAFEADRGEFIRQGGANWLVSGFMRWNLFDGSANRARVSEAEALLHAARAREREVSEAVRLEVYKAWAATRAAEERLTVTAAAVTQAEESLRITKNRFDNGLTTVTELLRNEVALLDARTRRLASIHDQRVAAAQLELAAGRLSAASEILQ